MSISRATALDRLEGLLLQVEEHLEKIARHPEHLSRTHWCAETRNWLDQMEEMVPHVGKRTGQTWLTRIERLRDALPIDV